MATQPSTGSIVDYLNSQKKDSSWTSRKKMFESAGLNKTLGEYRATDNANQNIALLNYLRSQDAQKSAQPNLGLIGLTPSYTNQSGGVTRMPVSQTAPTSSPAPTPQPEEKGFFGKAMDFMKSSATGDYFKTPEEREADKKYVTTLTGKPFPVTQAQPEKKEFRISQTGVIPNAPQVGQEPLYTPREGIGARSNGYIFTEQGWKKEAAPEVAPQAAPQVAPQAAPQAGAGAAGGMVGANDTVNNDGTVTTGDGTTMSEEDWIKMYLDSTEGKLESAKAEIDRAETKADMEREQHNLERAAEDEKERISKAFEARGLSMSGMKFEDLEDVEEELLYDLMDVDKTYGRRLLKEDIAFQEVVINGVAELIKAAEEDNDAALDTLKSMGYVYYNGQLVPTLERERMLWSQGMDTARYNLSASYYDLAVQKYLDDRSGGAGGTADEYALLGWLADNEGASLLDAESWAGRNTGLKDADVSDIFYNRPLETGADAERLAYNMMYSMVDTTDWESGLFNLDEAGDIEKYMREQFEANLTADSLDAPVGERYAWLPAIRNGEVVHIEVPELSFEDAVAYARTEWSKLEAEAREELEK